MTSNSKPEPVQLNKKVKIYAADTEDRIGLLTIEWINNSKETVSATLYNDTTAIFSCENIPKDGGRVLWHVKLCLGENLFIESSFCDLVTLVYPGI